MAKVVLWNTPIPWGTQINLSVEVVEIRMESFNFVSIGGRF